MRDRLTKAQVLALFATIDGPWDDLVAGVETALVSLYGDGSLDAHLRRLGRSAAADAVVAGDRDAVEALVVELNEVRHLA